MLVYLQVYLIFVCIPKFQIIIIGNDIQQHYQQITNLFSEFLIENCEAQLRAIINKLKASLHQLVLGPCFYEQISCLPRHRQWCRRHNKEKVFFKPKNRRKTGKSCSKETEK
ncbi:uncharacterized protein [Euwallacea fornicatus]|uniref:uncharacterized protein n=1 Tax=Euwallacea fornicatus TaxID=995702 RepID=UPI00338E926B